MIDLTVYRWYLDLIYIYILILLNEVFYIEALHISDMIAVPTMSFYGMEHWGLITYRESKMFYEEGVSSLDDKELMTIIIAHEVAHQVGILFAGWRR